MMEHDYTDQTYIDQASQLAPPGTQSFAKLRLKFEADLKGHIDTVVVCLVMPRTETSECHLSEWTDAQLTKQGRAMLAKTGVTKAFVTKYHLKGKELVTTAPILDFKVYAGHRPKEG
jgi:hypothetical protein